ncbi:isoleucine--tRNA ligase [Candidatus Saccharibacteria bacterium]|nr:isoleucine--tRNA ligase [Candidatus Saccharibacteria bacterium]
MTFKAREKQKHSEIEKKVIERWAKEKTFQQSVDARPEDNAFVFYDGPPFITGTPHHGTLLISTVKDVVARYQTMKGKRVERRWGWDCHGLPAEVYVEKQLGIKNKKEIGEKISISEYVNACRASMIKTGNEWEDTIERVGRWVEFKGAYKTMDPEFMESVWWAFKKLYEDGKIYEGEKILVYCTKDATPISKSEVAMENSYQEDTDPSVYVYFKLEDSDEYMLAWTTTPWTLPANVAVAVNSKLKYSLVEYDGRKVYVATDRLESVFTDEKHQPLNYKVLKEVSGKEFVGRKYHPLFENQGPESHVILDADFVTADDGTGIVHEAPAYGEEDYELCKKHNISVVSIVDENGNYTEGRWQEHNIWDVNKEIAKTLVAENKALKVEYIKHEYPHCHRCGTKLMYRAHPSWFMDIQGQKQDMIEASGETSWVPKALKEGRFKNILESAPDWNLSRDRYWATPIPVWKGQRPDGTEVLKVIGSYKEFEELTGKKLDDFHLPNVMDVEFEVDGVMLKHIGKVLDCWFESGSMPFAQFHYPFENREKFESSFPADFIIEAIDQTRGWFYSLTAVNVGLFGKSPFKNLVCTGFIYAADGKKISKKLKNYTDPMILMNDVSADALRYTMITSPVVVGEDMNLDDKDVVTTERKLTMLYNVLDFFLMYAEVDGWKADNSVPKPEHPLDKWILSKLQVLIKETSEHMDSYDLMRASRPILEYLDALSNWYIRRSRKRFWKSENDNDKTQAYHTLYFLLMELSKVLAPFVPFMAEDIYQTLGNKESVHLQLFPEHRPELVFTDLERDMDVTRVAVNEALSERAKNSLKVRQPLSGLKITTVNSNLSKEFTDIIKEEVNIKNVEVDTNPTLTKLTVILDTKITPELKREGIMREIVRHIQSARKTADLQVDDRISLSLTTDDKELQKAIDEHLETIKAETLTKELMEDVKGYETNVKVEKSELTISLKKSS